MKYSFEIYARAFERAIAEAPAGKEESFVKNLVALANRNGDGPALKKISAEVLKRLTAKGKIRAVKIVSARPLKEESRRKLKLAVGQADAWEEEIDPRLVGGIKIIVNGEKVLDNSFRSSLDNLFGK